MFSECKSTLPMLRNGYMAVTFQLRFCYDNVTAYNVLQKFISCTT